VDPNDTVTPALAIFSHGCRGKPSHERVPANGRWYMSKNIQEMADWIEFKLKGMQEGKD